MAISRKTASEFASDIENAIKSRNTSYETKVGAIPDLVINPLSNVLELQNERVRQVQQLLSLINDGSFSDEDLDNFVYNEALVRSVGGKATVILTFSRSQPPVSNITVYKNFPVSTVPDDETGSTVTFITTEDTTMYYAYASSYFNISTGQYELSVPAIAIVGTSIGNVGPNRVTVPLRTLNAFDKVFNKDSSSGGTDVESNASLINRYYLSLVGTSPNVMTGIEKIIFNNKPTVVDVNVIFGNNPLNVRSASDGGAVDVYTIGFNNQTATDSVIFVGTNQVMPLLKQPVMSISSVTQGATTYVENTDFTFTKDTSVYAGSTKGYDGIVWKVSATSTPAIGSIISVTYTYNSLMLELQNLFLEDRYNVPGRDILFKNAVQIDTKLAANVKIRSGFNIDTAINNIETAILNHINSLKLDDDVEVSDIQLAVRSVAAIDNFIITDISKKNDPVSTTDIIIGVNEYARIDIGDITLTY